MNNYVNVHWARFKALEAWQKQNKLYKLLDGDGVLVNADDSISELIKTGNLFIKLEDAQVIKSEIGFKEP